MLNFILSNLVSVYKYVFCSIGFLAAVLLLKAALTNLANVRKKRYASFGGAMCAFMLVMGVVIAALSGYFIAM